MFEHRPNRLDNYTEEDISREIRLYKNAIENPDSSVCKLWLEKFLEYHDNMLIDKWNSVVGKDDIVYFLGDLTLTRKMNKIAEIIKSLNGRKIMIMGNHDTRKPLDYTILFNEKIESDDDEDISDDVKYFNLVSVPASSLKKNNKNEYVFDSLGFNQVTKRPIILPRNGANVILMHEPPYDPNLSHDEYETDENGNLVDAHDHEIKNPIYWNPYDIFLFGHVHSNACPEEIHKNVKCVCLDRNNLLPYDLDEVIKEVKKNMKPRNYYVEYLEKIISDFNNDFGTQNYGVDEEEVKKAMKNDA